MTKKKKKTKRPEKEETKKQQEKRPGDWQKSETPPPTGGEQSWWHKLDPKVKAAIIGAVGVIFAAVLAAVLPILINIILGGSRVEPIIEPNRVTGPNLPKGLVIFDADEWHEQVINNKKEIVRTPQTELSVNLQKVGVRIPPPTVERDMTYSKPQDDALEIEYKFAGATEIGVHLVVHGFLRGPSDIVPLDKYEDGDIFLRVMPRPMDGGTSADSTGAITFALKLEHRNMSFWDEVPRSSSKGRLHESSGWCDIRIPIKSYLDQMRKAGSTEFDQSGLDGLLIFFADRYSSPRHGRFWLNTVRLVEKEDEPD